MKKLLVLLPALLAAGPAIPCGTTSGFCICGRVPASWALESSDAVFRGIVARAEHLAPDPGAPPDPQPWMRANVRVVERWKGVPGDTVTIFQVDLSDCGAVFEEGGEYLIYADRHTDSTLRSSSCSRTMAMTQKGAAEEMAELRRLTAAKP
jgi:hypothetical protein